MARVRVYFSENRRKTTGRRKLAEWNEGVVIEDGSHSIYGPNFIAEHPALTFNIAKRVVGGTAHKYEELEEEEVE